MNINSLKKSLIVFSIVLSASIGVIYACADGDWGWFGYSNFAPETFVDKSYAPLFYSAGEVFYEIGFESDYISRFNDKIVSEWSTFLDNKLTPYQVGYFLINDSSASEIIDLYNFIELKTASITSKKWGNQVNLQDNRIKEFVEFLYFAKQIENFSTSNFNPWNYENENSEATPSLDSALIVDVHNRYKLAKNPFLKNRYWFQTIKAKFYSNNEAEVITFFDETQKDIDKNTLYYRALAYCAGVNYHKQDYAKANYQYSIVFDKCPPLRVVTALNFHPQSEEDWNTSLALAKTNDEKAALWALLGFYADPVRAIGEIYKLNPKNPHINYLLTRAINQEEEKLQIDIKESARKYKSQIKDTLNQNSLALITTIARAENTSEPYLWYSAAGYVQTLNGNFGEATNFYTKAERLMPQNQLAQNQLHLLRFINTLSSMDVISSTNENTLLPDLKWLYSLPSDTNTTKLRYDAAISWSKQYISALYKTNKNTLFAQLFKYDGQYYKNDTQLEIMKTFLAKLDKSPFEKLAESIYPVSLSDIYEYQGIINTFQNKIEPAYACMTKAEGLNDVELYGNPFNGKIKDCHDCEHQAMQKVKFTKLKFIEIIKTMQENSAKGEDAYNNNMLIANAFYNISYYGNARIFYDNKLFNLYDDFYIKTIYNNDQAKLYYQKAFDAATNDEQRAKCSYLLAKCERNDYYTNTYKGYDQWADTNNQADFLKWKGFVALEEQYSNTKYYQDVIAECGYFNTYINREK